MDARKPISKTQRFEVFKRDGFVCQYCGAHPPSVILEIDHIKAVSAGGSGEIDNLLTSCFECNRGKGVRALSAIPDSISARAERILEGEAQIAAYEKIQKQRRRRQAKQIREIEKIYTAAFPGWGLTPKFLETIRIQFMPRLAPGEILDAMTIAVMRIPDHDRAIKYFCGVCWGKIREHGS